MPSLQLSRRRLLRAGAATLAVGLAGCSEAGGPEDTPRDPQSGPPEDALTDLTTVSVRRDDPEPFVSLDIEDTSPGNTLFLIESDDREALVFDPEPPGTTEARALIEGTDFENQTVAIVQQDLSACYRRYAEYVIPGDGDFEAEFCRILRDADVPCDEDARDMVATFVRVPYSYNARPTSVSYGSGTTCHSAYWATPTEGEQ